VSPPLRKRRARLQLGASCVDDAHGMRNITGSPPAELTQRLLEPEQRQMSES
jgi:hypothetical protein